MKRKGAPAARPKATESSYATDQPIRSAVDDRFARAPFAQRMAQTIAMRPEPASLVVGLSGAWGDGKTSVLYMIEECLKGEPDVIAVRFNPWHFTSEDYLIRGFFDTLASAMGKNLKTTGEAIGAAMKKYGSLLSVASASLASGAVTVDPGRAMTGMGESLSTTTLDNLKDRIEEGLSTSGKKVVVLIDDIDRLDRAETHAIFKLVKLSAGFEHTTYLLAFDEEVVASALGERYGEGGYAAGRAFLEKIIQVPLRLPPADATALRALTYEGIDQALQRAGIDIPREQADVFALQFRSGMGPRLTTPRQARLYANALMFSLPLVHGEVHLVDFMLVEGLRVFYPKLYAVIRDDPSPWLDPPERHAPERQDHIRALVERSTPGVTADEREQLLRVLLHLFPRSGRAMYDREWEREWSRDKRICSAAYVRRYFSYGIPPHDVSDRAIDAWVTSAPDLDPAQLEAALVPLLASVPAPFVTKMRQREDVVTETQARAMIPVLARNGHRVPLERGLLVLGGTRTQAAILIVHLLRRIPAAGERRRLAADVIETAIPLTFAQECLRWLMPDRDAQEDDHILARGVMEELGGVLLARIVAADRAAPLYRQFGAEAQSLYWFWQASSDAAGALARLQEHLAQSEEEVDAFLDIYVGEAWGMDDGLPRRGDLRRDAYDAIARLIDPVSIVELLRARYGDELADPQFHLGSDVPVNRRIAHQFMVIHQAVLADPG
jgi:predicted KAP-like P-loop ATPase